MDRLVPTMEIPTEVLSAPMLQDADTRPSKDALHCYLHFEEGACSCQSASSIETNLSGGTSSHCFPKAPGSKRPKIEGPKRLSVAASTEEPAPDA